MKKKNNYFINVSGLFAITLLLSSAVWFSVTAQSIVPFNPRASIPAGSSGQYNIKGDFQMIGNSNLVAANDPNGISTTQTNATNMVYINVDPASGIVNSSTATLQYPTISGVNPACTEIVYAGLYWSGRADNGGTASNTFSVTSGSTTANLDKAKVKFKFAGDTYQDITALGGTAINYPATNYGQMFAGYADVTGYVKSHGIGNYSVANIALREGDGGSTGYYGSWGLVVVYKNPNLTDKSITVFDGYGYMASAGSTQTLNVSGFSTPPSGAINATIGVMGGEGDLSLSGDPFSIQQKNTSTYLYLDHSGNTSTTATGIFNNFFDSSITIAGNPPRNPNHTNNYGSDIHMLNLVNTSNTIIGNGQTSTSFQYGSTQDTYIIYSIAFSVDNYVPQPTSTVVANAVTNGSSLSPGDTYTLDYKITNPGNEAVTSTKFTVPIPFNQEYVSSSVTTWDVALLGPQVNPVFTPAAPGQVTGGTLTWNLGTLPLMSAADRNKVLASLHAQFRITTNCLLITAPTCAGVTEQNSFISGTGQISSQTVNRPSITGSTTTPGGCTVENTGPFSLILNINPSALTCPSNIITDPTDPTHKIVTYNAAASTIPRATIANDFPAGTIFYTKAPSDPTFDPIANLFTGNFNAPANGTDPSIRYYAVTPSMPGGCYIIISISRGQCLVAPKTTGIALDTKVGITLLKRAGVNDGNWPMIRKGGFIALESNSRGFVVTRLTDAQIAGLTPAEGMMVYNISPGKNCLMIYDGTGWKCFNVQSCP